MALRWKETVLATGWGLSLVFNIGLITERKTRPVPPAQESELPSPAAIQRMLNEIEPESRLKVDGKIGPLTLEKWDRVFCEQSARKASEGFYK